VDAAAKTSHLYRVLEVQHLVIQQVFDRIAWTGRPVKDATHDDRIVRCIVMAQRTPRHSLTPGKLGSAQQPAKETQIQGVKDFFQVVETAFRAREPLVSSRMANLLRLPRDRRAGGEPLEANVVGRINGFLVELGKKNVRDRANHALGSTFHQIGKADIDLALAQPNRRVE